jgi:hypothetical protein
MKHLSLLVFVIFGFSQSNGQTKGEVLDSVTHSKITYVNIWVQNQNFGTTTDKNGKFKLQELADSSTLVFSAIGYESKIYSIKKLPKQIFLKPIAIELATVTVIPPKFKKKIRTGKIDKKAIKFWRISYEQPWRIGKIFPYNSTYLKTPFLKEIEILTKTHAERILQIHILEIGEGAVETWEILESNILKRVGEGKSPSSRDGEITKIDLKPYQIKMPKSGVMIVVEWLLIDENRYEFEWKDKNGEIHNDGYFYEPAIGNVPNETNENTWIYKNGVWQKDEIRKTTIENYNGKYAALMIELILSD